MRLYPQYSSSEGKKHHKNRIRGLPVTNNIENRLKGADSSLINESANPNLWPQE